MSECPICQGVEETLCVTCLRERNEWLRRAVTVLADTHGECIDCSAKEGEEHTDECEIGRVLAGRKAFPYELEIKNERMKQALHRIIEGCKEGIWHFEIQKVAEEALEIE